MNKLESARSNIIKANNTLFDWEKNPNKTIKEKHITPIRKMLKQALIDLQNYMSRDKGEISDGYHTFNELYEHRHMLFACICRGQNAWKSKLHHDGTMFDGWFIAGIETEKGQITYHIPLRLWDMYLCEELKKSPEWDSHTSNDVLDRIESVINKIKEEEKWV
jgi:hypothetical protein